MSMDLADPKAGIQLKMEKFPRDIFFNIFSRLPLKFVIRSSCVSKSWLDMIKDPSFVKLYFSESKPEPSLLFLSHQVIGEKNIISISPLKHKESQLSVDETAIDHMVSSVSFDLVGTCDGLLCFTSSGEEEVTMVCNPVTREHIILPNPAITPSPESYARTLAFGFDPVAKKYKVIRLPGNLVRDEIVEAPVVGAPLVGAGVMANMDVMDDFGGAQNHFAQALNQFVQADVRAHMRSNVRARLRSDVRAHMRSDVRAHMRSDVRAEVYTLGTDSWREVQGVNCCPHGKPVYANGVVYWLVDHDMKILSFDLASEKFKLIEPPRRFGKESSLAELGGCLSVVDLSSVDLVEISVLKDPTNNFWDLKYIIPVQKPCWLDWQSPRLICASELNNVLVVWLQDSLVSYNSRAFRTRHLKIKGFPTWFDWEICSGYRGSLVPLGNSHASGDDRRDAVHFISEMELHSLFLKAGTFGDQKAVGRCDDIVTCFRKNGLLI